MEKMLVVLVTFPSEEKARQIGTVLVKKQLIACINCIPAVKSIYCWEGEICEDLETLGILKLKKSNWKALEMEIQRLHPYDVPEIIALNPDEVTEPYLNWVVNKA